MKFNYINVFHGTLKEWAFDIVDNGFMDPKRRDSDDHWLGHGIYFYPCYEEAKRWAVSKSKKYKTNYDVVVADMNKEKLYNLEDSAHLRKFKKFALDLDKMIKSDGICLDFTKGLNRNSKDFSIQVTKRKRCFTFDYFANQFQIAGIMCSFCMDMQFSSNHKTNFLLMSGIETQICVYDKSIIENLRLAADFSMEGYI